jgi:hypothetical protein
METYCRVCIGCLVRLMAVLSVDVFSGIFSMISSCSNFFISFSTFRRRWNGILRWSCATGVTAISFPEHARSQVKGGHNSGEGEMILAGDWLAADSTLDFQREFYACSAIVAKYRQSIHNFSSKIWYLLHWNRLKITKNSGGNMYESFGLIGKQLPEKYKRTSTFRAKALRLVLLVFVYIVLELYW